MNKKTNIILIGILLLAVLISTVSAEKPQIPTLTTDKRVYASGENVTFTFHNNYPYAINLNPNHLEVLNETGVVAWYNRNQKGGNVTIPAGGSYSIKWNQRAPMSHPFWWKFYRNGTILPGKYRGTWDGVETKVFKVNEHKAP